MITPSFELESRLLRTCRYVVGMDEVGRGALAGPVAVGAVLVDMGVATTIPAGLADSKLLTAARREALYQPVCEWATGYAVGWTEPAIIDEIGISAALGMAGRQALSKLTHVPDVVILDGSYDWLTPRPRLEQTCLSMPEFERDNGFDSDTPQSAPATMKHSETVDLTEISFPTVLTQIKADQTCASVAAASIVAKVDRDRYMVEKDCGYGWASNKGYGSAAHRAAIRERGLAPQHRVSFCRKILEVIGNER